MKRIIGILVMSVVVGTGAFAQTPSFKNIEGSFQGFASDVATSLPYASNIGLNWSWAYIGNLPHFGVGLAAGFVTIPTTGFDQVASALGVTNVLPSELTQANLGFPLPAYVAEARIGGLFLPFDIGIKVGFIPKQVNLGAVLPPNTNLDFHLYGAQIRYALVKERFLIPAISVGIGFNHFDGTIGTTIGNDIPIATVPTGTVAMQAPDLTFNWNSNSIDATIQVSKKILLIVTPYIGAGLSYGFSTAGGGLSSQLLLNGNPVSSSELTYINDYLKSNGQSTISLGSTGFNIAAQANGFSARAFGGVSVNLAFLKIDGTVMYNLITQKLGATLGTRLQF